mgnify:FL=1
MNSEQKAPLKMDADNMPKLLLSFALPATVGMLANAVYNIVDRIFVGRCSGPDGIAAITLGFPTMIVMFAFSLLFAIGGSSRVSILRGARKRRAAERALIHTIALLALAGLCGSLIGLCFVKRLLLFSGASDKLLPMGTDYLRIILIGGPLALMGYGVSSLVRACGSPRYAMFTQVAGAIANIFLDWFFIVKLKMGVKGAALGTVLAEGAGTLMGLAYFFAKSSPLRIKLAYLMRPSLSVVKRIISVGFGQFVVELSFCLLMVIINNVTYRYGGNVWLLAIGIFSNIDTLFFMPSMAVGEAAQPIVGYNYGAGKPHRVIEAVMMAIRFTTALYLVSFVIAELFTPQLIRLFSSNPKLLAVGVPGMRITYAGVAFVGLPIVTISALQGLGRAKEAMLLSVTRQVLFMFAPALILPQFFGINGVWASYPTGDICGSIMAVFFLRRLIKWLKSPEALKAD